MYVSSEVVGGSLLDGFSLFRHQNLRLCWVDGCHFCYWDIWRENLYIHL